MEVQYKLLSESFEEAIAANREAQSQQVVILSQNRSLRARYQISISFLIIVWRSLKVHEQSFYERSYNWRIGYKTSMRVTSSRMTLTLSGILDYWRRRLSS